MSYHRIIIGDSRKMDALDDESVHLIVTSPPYWQLKDYGPKQQIGYNDFSCEKQDMHSVLTWEKVVP